MTWKKNPASMGGGGDFPREFGMWFGGAGRAGHPATSRGASILKKSKEKELVGKERKKVIAKLSKQLAAKERLYRDNKGNLVRGKDRKKDSKKTHDTLGRKIRRGSERKSPKSLPHVILFPASLPIHILSSPDVTTSSDPSPIAILPLPVQEPPPSIAPFPIATLLLPTSRFIIALCPIATLEPATALLAVGSQSFIALLPIATLLRNV